MAEALREMSTENRRFCSNRVSLTQNFTNHSSCQKTTINGLSRGIRMRAQFSFVVSQTRVWRGRDERTDGRTRVCLSYTRLTDRRTDGWTVFSWLYRALHYMQSHGKIVKNVFQNSYATRQVWATNNALWCTASSPAEADDVVFFARDDRCGHVTIADGEHAVVWLLCDTASIDCTVHTAV